MWVFLSGGMLMPAMIPEDVLRKAATREIRDAVEQGWDLQIRGRVREHLEWFIENYMEPGSCSVVYESRNKDYNVRAYTDREAFGEGLKAASLAMDYVKFKDTAKRFTWGQKYYDLLIKVWSASTVLARPYDGEKPGSARVGTGSSYRRGRKNKKQNYPQRGQVGSSFFFDDEPDDDLDDWWNHSSTSERTSRSIHEMTDEEIEEMELLY